MSDFERFEVELPPDLAQFVRSQAGQGGFASDGAVVCEAVRALHRRATQLEELTRIMNASIDDPRPSIPAEEVDAHFRRRAEALNLG